MENLKTFLLQNGFGILALILAPALAWFFNRRKENVEVKKVDAEGTNILVTSSNELVISWENFATKMQSQYKDCIKINGELSLSVDKLIIYKENVNRFVTSMRDILEDVLIDIEKINPELAKAHRIRLDRITSSFKLEE